jgi:hypothetical protein
VKARKFVVEFAWVAVCRESDLDLTASSRLQLSELLLLGEKAAFGVHRYFPFLLLVSYTIQI